VERTGASRAPCARDRAGGSPDQPSHLRRYRTCDPGSSVDAVARPTTRENAIEPRRGSRIEGRVSRRPSAFEALGGLAAGGADDAALGVDGAHELGGGDVEGRVTATDSV